MENPGSSKKRVLVVEDEPANSQVCTRTLTGEGFEVEIAVNGMEAEDKLRERDDYDLILIDIRTPLMNGKELYQWLKEKRPKVVKRVIFTTGDVIGEDTQNLLHQSDRPFLPKPFTPDELSAVVIKTLEETEK